MTDDERAPRAHPIPIHLNARYLGVVALGGTIGTGCRELLSLLYPPVDGLPYTILAINVFGALLLGTLLGTLGHRGPDEGRRRIVRLLLGTGVMGGFTTYSSLATDSALLAGDDRFAAAALYSVGTVLIGALGTWMGIAIAAAAHRPQGEGSE